MPAGKSTTKSKGRNGGSIPKSSKKAGPGNANNCRSGPQKAPTKITSPHRQIEDDLAQARDIAEERARELEVAIRELEGFTYSVSHDLRAPVRHIIMFSDLLRRRYSNLLDDKGQQFLETIATSSRHLGTMMDGLLDLSRLGRKSLQKSAVDLAALVEELVDGFDREQSEKRIEWSIGNLPTVEGDESMLRLVLANLIDNAVKFSSKAEIPQIEIGYREEAGSHVISIKDNGVGFNMEYADKLFGVFQRLHREGEFKGTGIGLANVARIIQRHGGRVWAEGAVGWGALFSFSLPKPS